MVAGGECKGIDEYSVFVWIGPVDRWVLSGWRTGGLAWFEGPWGNVGPN